MGTIRGGSTTWEVTECSLEVAPGKPTDREATREPWWWQRQARLMLVREAAEDNSGTWSPRNSG